MIEIKKGQPVSGNNTAVPVTNQRVSVKKGTSVSTGEYIGFASADQVITSTDANNSATNEVRRYLYSSRVNSAIDKRNAKGLTAEECGEIVDLLSKAKVDESISEEERKYYEQLHSQFGEYAEGVKKETKLKAEMELAKRDYERSDRSVFSLLPKALNYIGGLTESFDPYKTDYKKSKSKIRSSSCRERRT